MIPLFIVEEHHEAFFIWRSRLVVDAPAATLLHVDDHPDFTAPRLTRSIHSLNGNEADLYRFTIEQLGISTFIMPAIYLKLFDRCYWLRCHTLPVNTEQKGLVYSHHQEGEKLIYTADSFENRLNYPDTRSVSIFFQTRYEHFPEDTEVVLDIDLDYFSSNIPPDNFQGRIETTEAEFSAFQWNPYHYLRLITDKVTPIKEDGRFFFVYNNIPTPVPSTTRVSEQVISERVACFLAFLKEKRVKPILIDLCRSRFSNYTPADQWELIEAGLLSGLKELYDVKVTHIGDLIAEQGLWVYRF